MAGSSLPAIAPRRAGAPKAAASQASGRTPNGARHAANHTLLKLRRDRVFGPLALGFRLLSKLIKESDVVLIKKLNVVNIILHHCISLDS